MEQPSAVLTPRKPRAPVKPEDAYATSKRPTVKKENPEFTKEQVAAKVKEMWQAETSDVKEKYNEEYQLKLAKYNADMAVWNENPSSVQEIDSEPVSRSTSRSRQASPVKASKTAYKKSTEGAVITCPHCHHHIHLKPSALTLVASDDSMSEEEDPTHVDPPEEVIVAGVKNIGLSQHFKNTVGDMEARLLAEDAAKKQAKAQARAEKKDAKK